MLNPYYGKCVQQECNRPNTMATLSERGPIQERITANLESRLRSWPSGHSQLPSELRVEKIVYLTPEKK